ncbi:enoyl-CoA hydratase/isomerase family protein [Agrobacterium tumefaciens]|uniref:Enoyl-CoA hydratase n=1 Tax=Agrobacterium tumefaciens TaxID=358 RepID=A0A176XGX4_AGRTU|nr:enoyl-CoA hydratase/isomerase family protein [Agrobacterium tumefaciens]OAE48205.1 hypothetical protein A7J57_22650 [Agrobacterium tumefaciens]
MTFDTISVMRRSTAVWIAFNRPEVLNAINSQCVAESLTALRQAETDPDVRAIVFTGSGERAFTAGADIRELRGFGQHDIVQYNRGWLDFFRRIEMCRKPVVAAVNGWAMGGGTELSLACDFVICSTSARFGLAEINIGVIPGAGAAVRATRWLGRLRAKELVMLGRPLSGMEAVEWQMANLCVPDDQLKTVVDEFVTSLAGKAPLALAAAKMSINVGAEAPYDVALEYELQEFARLFATADREEGMSAFLEKRKPKFTGR